jgi:chemotaxis family two-component system response regulator Rcp1
MNLDTANMLLVEDNPGDVRLIVETLEEYRLYNTLNVVSNGIEALAYLRQEGHHADATRPDLILLDLNLPRMDGREVLAEIKTDASLRQIPVVVLTTSDQPQDVADCYDQHANCYITKPLDFDEFVRVMHSIENFWFTIVRLPDGQQDG